MLNVLDIVYCDGLGAGIDSSLPALTHLLINIIKIGIPILLIIFGMMDLGKAVMSNDEKEMKGAQTKFIKRCLYAVIVFFIVAIVQFVVSVLGTAKADTGANSASPNAKSCIECFVNGKCNSDKDLTTETNA